MRTAASVLQTKPSPKFPLRAQPALHRKCACEDSPGSADKCDGCKNKSLTVHRHTTGERTLAQPGADRVNETLRSSGQPLDRETREYFEPRMGHDFAGVRIHTDDRAAETAHALDATAYTVGKHVVFAHGQYAPSTDTGRRVLAHELTHVIQQDSAFVPDAASLQVADAAGAEELEAQQAERDMGEAGGDGHGGQTPKCGGNRCLPAGQLLEKLLPENEDDRAAFLGNVLSAKAVGVDGSWLSTNLGAGVPLDPKVAAEMRSKFHDDFSSVRIHTGRAAGLVARSLNANAVTVGRHIAFADGQYDPASKAGRKLLMHELAHTVQQRNVVGIPSQTIPIGRPAHFTEREAEAVADGGAPGESKVPLSAPTGAMVNLSVCGVIVEGVCWAAFSAIAAAVAALCVVGTTITVGGLAIPCTAVVIAAAGLAAWDAVMCTNILKQEICGEPIEAPAPARPNS